MYTCEIEIDLELLSSSQTIMIRWIIGEGASHLNDDIPRLCATYIYEYNDRVSHNCHIDKYDSNYHRHAKASTMYHFTLPKMKYYHVILNSSSFNMDTQVNVIEVTYITDHYPDSRCG